jgi:hypothetical protein
LDFSVLILELGFLFLDFALIPLSLFSP